MVISLINSVILIFVIGILLVTGVVLFINLILGLYLCYRQIKSYEAKTIKSLFRTKYILLIPASLFIFLLMIIVNPDLLIASIIPILLMLFYVLHHKTEPQKAHFIIRILLLFIFFMSLSLILKQAGLINSPQALLFMSIGIMMMIFYCQRLLTTYIN
ncbi:MAG: hypothetical protein QW806_03785 [Nitrososphaerota archaeon]